MTMPVTERLLRTEGLRRDEMKEPDDVSAMLRLKALGWGARRIAAELGCSRTTVRRRQHDAACASFRPARRRSAMPTDLTLYTNSMSRGRSARWMLEEVGVPYETRLLDFDTTMKAADYLAINPMGKVPAIQHGQTVVTEAAAICAYLADVFPNASLAPLPAVRGDYYRWLFFGAGPLDQAVTMDALGMSVPPGGSGTVGTRTLPTVLDVLEAAVSQRDYLAGDAFSAADVYVGFNIGFGLRFGTIEPRPGPASLLGPRQRPGGLQARQWN